MATEPFMIAVQIAAQARLPVFIWGMPGSGKTTNIEILARVLNEQLWTMILSVREPTDQGGIPKVTDDGVTMVPARAFKELVKAGKGTIFFDEFNTATPPLQASALRIINEGWAGDLKLPEDTSFLAAGNDSRTSSGAYDLMSALANRMVHIDWKPSIVNWCDGMDAGFPEPEVAVLGKDWKNGIRRMRSYVSSFIRKNPDQLENEPDDPYLAGRAWPSRRTWTMAATLLAAAESAGYDMRSRVARILVAGCVGNGGQEEFHNWLVKQDLRDPEDYLKDPHTPLPKRQDQMMVVINSVVSASLDEAFKKKEMLERQKAAWALLGRINRECRQPDLIVPGGRVLAVNMLPDFLQKGMQPPELDEIGPILEKANVDFSREVS